MLNINRPLTTIGGGKLSYCIKIKCKHMLSTRKIHFKHKNMRSVESKRLEKYIQC